MFCVASLEVPLSVSFKVRDEDFGAFGSREGFMPAPYMARAKWVTVNDISWVKPKEWPVFVQQLYTLVCSTLTKKVRQELGIHTKH